jgi:hypothetical protein
VLSRRSERRTVRHRTGRHRTVLHVVAVTAVAAGLTLATGGTALSAQ